MAAKRIDVELDQHGLRKEYADLAHHEAIVQRADEGVYIVRTLPLGSEDRDEAGNVTRSSERQRVEQALTERFGPMTVLSFDQVSPIVAAEVVRNALLAVIAACAGITVYLWWAFRHVKDSWRYGVCAVAALVHDVLVVVGVFSILGRVFSVDLDALFITAVMTVI